MPAGTEVRSRTKFHPSNRRRASSVGPPPRTHSRGAARAGAPGARDSPSEVESYPRLRTACHLPALRRFASSDRGPSTYIRPRQVWVSGWDQVIVRGCDEPFIGIGCVRLVHDREIACPFVAAIAGHWNQSTPGLSDRRDPDSLPPYRAITACPDHVLAWQIRVAACLAKLPPTSALDPCGGWPGMVQIRVPATRPGRRTRRGARCPGRRRPHDECSTDRRAQVPAPSPQWIHGRHASVPTRLGTNTRVGSSGLV